MLKSEAQALVERMRDYIPKGRSVDVSKLLFRRAHDHEIHLCGVRTGRDIQSGPYYCGALADWLAQAEGDGQLAAVCDKHAKRLCLRQDVGSARGGM
jgi:hypothetical protein